MQDFEKLGVFYLGREYDWQKRQAKPELLLYDSRDLVTHAVCVGMTGSGKTGLCLALIEEAAIDGIPALLIDPKGDPASQRERRATEEPPLGRLRPRAGRAMAEGARGPGRG